MLHVDVGGATLGLLPERAAYVASERTLLVADVHVGKASTFRSLGVPVPTGSTAGTLQRLSAALQGSGAERLIVLGDLIHSRRSYSAATLQALRTWRGAHAQLTITLLRGNHDARAGALPRELGIEVVDPPLRCGALWLLHEPSPRDDGYVLAGHVHPCVTLAARAFDRVRLPCFHFGERVGVLPAFGEFTGGHAWPRAPGDRVYAIAGQQVRAV
jgi:DNA ligase-associated metallophosphoesterase